MLAEHIVLNAPESVDDRRDLMNDVQTIPVRVNHFLQAADLSLDATEPRELFVVTNLDAAVAGSFFSFFRFFQIR